MADEENMLNRNFLGVFNVLANMSKKRFNFRVTTTLFTLFIMLARSQRIEGVTSQCYDKDDKPTNKHYVFWDCEGCTLEQIKKTLRKVQKIYRLSNIYIASDNGTSFRAWCFSQVPFETLLKILIDSKSILDYGFLYYTFKRQAATLRTDRKEGRPFQHCMAMLETYFVPLPTGKVKRVVYYTGCEKKGTSIVLGGE